MMKKETKMIFLLMCLSLSGFLQAQQLNEKVFEVIDLSYPELADVKKAYDRKDLKGAAGALLDYYQKRTSVKHPAFNQKTVKVSDKERQIADEALAHILRAHESYQPSFYYGKDIDWRYWPVKDNELRWQLHRQEWFVPMGKMYYTTRDEKYAKEWVYQYMDWIKKNPLVPVTKDEFELVSTENLSADTENARFAWRPLEAGTRLERQIQQFMLFKDAESFTPEFLTELLVNYHKHAEYICCTIIRRREIIYCSKRNKIFMPVSFFLNSKRPLPKGEWHNQPDNGTFELWFKGTNLFPDSGFYIYEGDENVMKLRKWFRQTMVHNTLTLDHRNLETQASVTRLWKPEGTMPTLVTENQSYKDLKHRRSVFFVDQKYFVIVDEAVGSAQGSVGLHYQLQEGSVNVDSEKMILTSNYGGNADVKLQCFAPQGAVLQREEGWQATLYLQRSERTAVAFNVAKEEMPIRYITVIYPTDDGNMPVISAKFLNQQYDERSLKVEVSLDGAKKELNYKL